MRSSLGAVQGPAELLPVSSSGHLVLVPALLGWPYGELDPELRKSFEVALHAGGALALLIGLRAEVAEYLRALRRHNLPTLALSFAPAAVGAPRCSSGTIERRLSQPLPRWRSRCSAARWRWPSRMGGRSTAAASDAGARRRAR